MEREIIREKLLVDVARHRLGKTREYVVRRDYNFSLDGFRPYPLSDLYLVSPGGDIRTRAGLLLAQRLDREGYCLVSIQVDGKKKSERVHRMVAQTFLDNPENKPWVNHKDGVKHNNRLTNLEWCTAKENHEHAKNVLKVGMYTVTVDQILIAKIQSLTDTLVDLKKRDDCTRAMEEKINRALREIGR